MARPSSLSIINEPRSVEGFSFAGVSAGLKTQPGVKDLGLIVADRPVSAAGAFTSNLIQAAPVKIARARLRAGKARAVLVNSGSANCFTGRAGEKLAIASCDSLAKLLGCPPHLVIPCSTGVIGRLYDLGRLKQGLKVACAELRPHGASDFAHAIMTTDTRPKVSCTTLALGGRDVTLMGIAKGAGMIAPAMATMLAFIVTDANASSGLLRQALKKALPTSFNALTVDGDMSTNDAVLLLASGRAANSALSSRLEVEKFEQAVSAIAKDLARQIAEDGEGATKLAIVRVKGARSRAEADKVARRIANSPLVKTALFGCDPNVGRILAAAGACGVKFDPERVELSVGRARIAAHGRIIESALDKARQAMQAREVEICVDLKQGDAEAVVLTCDLSVDYVRINAEYTT